MGVRPLDQKQSSSLALEVREEKRRQQNLRILEMGALEALQSGEIPLSQFPNALRGEQQYQLLKQEPFTADEYRGVWCYGQPGSGKSTYAFGLEGGIYKHEW